VRHIEVNQLIQDRVANGDIEIRKVDGKGNVAGVLAGPVDAGGIRVRLRKTGRAIVRGRHSVAPEGS